VRARHSSSFAAPSPSAFLAFFFFFFFFFWPVEGGAAAGSSPTSKTSQIWPARPADWLSLTEAWGSLMRRDLAAQNAASGEPAGRSLHYNQLIFDTALRRCRRRASCSSRGSASS